jgi:hypothetical protein
MDPFQNILFDNTLDYLKFLFTCLCPFVGKDDWKYILRNVNVFSEISQYLTSHGPS